MEAESKPSDAGNGEKIEVAVAQSISCKTKAIRQKRKDKASVAEIVGLVEKQLFRCALSGMEIEPNTANLDHKNPVSCGGTDDISNLQWLHKDINQAKGALTNEQFIEMCKRVVAWNR